MNNIPQHTYEEGTASEQQQQQQEVAGVEARSAGLEQQQHLQQPHLDEAAVLSSSLPDDGRPGNGTEICDSNSYGSGRGSETNASVSSSTDGSILSGATVSPGSSTGRRASSDNDSSNVASYTGVARTDFDASPKNEPYSDWRLPGAAPLSVAGPLCAASQENLHVSETSATAAAHEVPYLQQQTTQDGGEDGESESVDISVDRGGGKGDEETRSTLEETDAVTSRSNLQERGRFALLPDSPDRFFRLTSTGASLTPHPPPAHSAAYGRGFLRSSKSSTRKRIRRDSSSSCSEQDGCRVATPLEGSPRVRACPRTPPTSPSVLPSVGETALPATTTDGSQLTPETHGQVPHKDDVAGAHLHAALLQRFCATPRRRKLSSSSSSAASDEQQTVASLSSPAMLYAPIRTPRNGTAQQQRLQMHQEHSQGRPPELPGLPREHQQQHLLVPPAHEDVPPQLSRPELPLAVSGLPAQQDQHEERQEMEKQAGQHTQQQSQELLQQPMHVQQPAQGQTHQQIQQQTQQQMQQHRQQMQQQAEEHMQQQTPQLAPQQMQQQMQQELQQQMQQQMVMQQHRLRASTALVADEEVKTGQRVGGLLPQHSDTAEARSSQHGGTSHKDVQLSMCDYEARERAADVTEHPGETDSYSTATGYAGDATEHQESARQPSHEVETHAGRTVISSEVDGSSVADRSTGAGIAPVFPPESHAAATPVVLRFPESSEAEKREVQEQRMPLGRPSSNPTVTGESDAFQESQQQQQHQQSQEHQERSIAFALLSRLLHYHVGKLLPRRLMLEGIDGERASITEELQGNGSLENRAILQSVLQQMADVGIANRQPALNSLGHASDERLSIRGEALTRLSDAAFSDVAPSRGSAAAFPSHAPGGHAATDVLAAAAAAAAARLPCYSRTPRTPRPGDAREIVRDVYGTAGGSSSSHPAQQREELRRAVPAAEAFNGRSLEHSPETLKSRVQQVGAQAGGNFAAAAKTHPTLSCVPACVGLSPQPCPASPAETPAYTEGEVAGSPGEFMSAVVVESGPQEVKDSRGFSQPADTPLPASLTPREETPSVDLPLGEAEAPAAANNQHIGGDACADVGTQSGGTAETHAAAHEKGVADAALQVGSTTEAEDSAGRGSFSSAALRDNMAQQLRLQQVVQVLQEHCLRLRLLEEQTSQRMQQMLGGPEYHALHTRLQRLRKQQRLLLQLQQRVENRSVTLWRQGRSALNRLSQQERQQLYLDGQQEPRQREQEERTAELQAVSFQDDKSEARKRRGSRKPSHQNGAGEPTRYSYSGQERHAGGTGRETGLYEISTSAETRETKVWLPYISAGDTKEAEEERAHYEACLAGASAAIADTPPVRSLEAGLRSWKRREATCPETDIEEQTAALRGKRHQEDVAALMRVKRTFLRRQQQQQQSIPLPEESASEMYWASLLQPTEMLLDRTVALSTSLIQPGVYVYLNKCFWESNQRDWTSDPAYSYSCSSSSCSSGVPCRISRPAVDLLPVYYASRFTPVHTLAALSPTAAAAAAVAPSDADSILNFCFRVSLLRRCNKRRQPPHKRRVSRTPQENRSSGKNSSNSTTCSSNTSSNSGSDTSSSGTDAGSRRGSRDDGLPSTIADSMFNGILQSISPQDGCDTALLRSDESSGATAGERSSVFKDDLSGEQAIESLLPFPPNIFPSQSGTPGDVGVACCSAPGITVTAGNAVGPAEGAGGFGDTTVDACSGPASGSAVRDRHVAVSCNAGFFPTLPPVELKGPHPAWVLGATRAAAAAAKAALAAMNATEGQDEEGRREAEMSFSEEEEQQQGTYALSVPVSLYGFSLSRRLAAAARDAAFNQIAAAAAVVAAASQGTPVASTAVGTARLAEGGRQDTTSVEPPTEVPPGAEADGSQLSSTTGTDMSGGNMGPTRKAATGRRAAVAAHTEQRVTERRRSSVSSTSSRYCRTSVRDADNSWINEKRRSSTSSMGECDRAWDDISRDMLLRRDPPLRKAWVSGISWRRGSSDHRSTYWSRSSHASGGGLSSYGSNSPSPSSVAWWPSAQRSSWWGGGGTGGVAARESSFYALRDQQQGSTASLDVPTQAEGIFVLRERLTGLPLAVRATVFCPDEEKTTNESMRANTTTAFREAYPTGGGGTVGASSTSSRRRPCSPTRLMPHHVQARRGATGSASATAGGSNIQQGGQLLSKLFVVDAHATSAEEAMPIKLRRVKQMAKAWFRHKKLLALLLYWQRSQQQQQGGTAGTSTAEEQPLQQPPRDGRKEWKKRASTDGTAARTGDVPFHHFQESGDEGTARQAETRDVAEVEALGCLLRDEREEACYVSHLHFLGHALVSRFSSLVTAASLAWSPFPRAADAVPSSRRREQGSSNAKQVDSDRTKAGKHTVSEVYGRLIQEEAGLGMKENTDCTNRDYTTSSSTGSLRKTRDRSDTGEGALPLEHAAPSVVAESEEKQEQKEGEPGADAPASCWSLRIGLRWRESYFAFEYYVAAVHTPAQRRRQPHQQHCEGPSEKMKSGPKQQQESDQLEQCRQKQHERKTLLQEYRKDDDQAVGDGHVTDSRGSTGTLDGCRNGSSCRSEMARRDGPTASAVLLLDEMLQPCLCDVTAVQHAFQAVMMRVLPFVCINSSVLRLLLRQSPELRSLSRTILQRWDGAVMCEPEQQYQRCTAQQKQQEQLEQEGEQAQSVQPVQQPQENQQERQEQREQDQQVEEQQQEHQEEQKHNQAEEQEQEKGQQEKQQQQEQHQPQEHEQQEQRPQQEQQQQEQQQQELQQQELQQQELQQQELQQQELQQQELQQQELQQQELQQQELQQQQQQLQQQQLQQQHLQEQPVSEQPLSEQPLAEHPLSEQALQEQELQEQDVREQTLQEQKGATNTSTEQGALQLLDDLVIDEIIAAVETEERLQRSTAVAIAAAFHQGDSSSSIDASSSDTGESGSQECAYLPLFLFDCLLQSNYPPAVGCDPVVHSCSAESVCSAAAAFASAVNAAEDTSAGENPQQLDNAGARIKGAAVSLLLAAKEWGASLVDRRRSRSSSRGKRTEGLVENSWFPFHLQGLKKERSTASRLRQLLLGTFLKGDSATTNAGGSAANVCAVSQASATAASPATFFGEDQVEVSGFNREDATAEERRKKDAATKLEKQIKWISARCSYVGVTDAPATSRKAALLLALLFPSQRQLLLEHIELRDHQFQDEMTRVPESSDASDVADAAAHMHEAQQSQRLRPASHLLQRGDAKQQRTQHRQGQCPLQPEKQMPDETKPDEELQHNVGEQGRHKHRQMPDAEVCETLQKHGNEQSLWLENVEDEELDEEECLERVRVAAEMMLEGALEELWPGHDDEENTWQRVFRDTSTKREVHEEVRMLDTEIPFYTEEAPAAPAESMLVLEQTGEQTELSVGPVSDESVATGRMTTEQPDEEQEHPEKEKQSQKMHGCEQQLREGEQQRSIKAEPGGDRLAPQEKVGNGSPEDEAASPAEDEGALPTSGSEPDATDGVVSDGVATEEDDTLPVSNEENSEVDTLREETDSCISEESDEVKREREEEDMQHRTEEEEESGDGTLASASETDHQDESEEVCPARDGQSYWRMITKEEDDEEAAATTERLKQLLLLPVECSGVAGSSEEGTGRLLARDCRAGAETSERRTMAQGEKLTQHQQQKPREPAESSVQNRYQSESAQAEIRGDAAAGDSGEKQSSSALGRAAERRRPYFYPFKGSFSFSSFPYASSDLYIHHIEDSGSMSQNFSKVSFAPLWERTRLSSPDPRVAAAFPWYVAAAMRLAAADVLRPVALDGRRHASDTGRKRPVARGGADVWLLLRWYNSCLAESSSSKSGRSSVLPSNRSITNGGRAQEITCSCAGTGCSMDGLEKTTDGRILNGDDRRNISAAEGSEGDTNGAAADTSLDKLLLACSSRRRPQQPPLWAGGIDVSTLREGLDYRIDWRGDWDIGDGHVDCGAAEEGFSSSTIVDSSSEEEEVSPVDRAARGSKETDATTGRQDGGTTIRADLRGGKSAGRRTTDAAYGGEPASGAEESGFRPQEKKKSLRERLLSSSASSGRLAEGREPLQAAAEEKREIVLDYIEERVVDQQLRDFLQGLLTTVRHARAATFAARYATHPPRTNIGAASGASTPGARDEWGLGLSPGKHSFMPSGGGRGSRYLPAGGVYQEDMFPSSAYEVGGGASIGGDALRKHHPTWNAAGDIAPTWLFSLAAAEVTQGQLRAAEAGRLPETSPSSGIWSYVLLPAALAAAAPPASSPPSHPAVTGGRVSMRQQQEEAKKQQESRTMAASALAAAAALLRQQQEDLRGNASMPWTSLYLAAATDAAATAARQATQAHGGRHRAELSVPSSTCSTPRPAQDFAAAYGSVAGAASARRGGGWRSVPASLSPGAADVAMSAAATMNVPASPRGSTSTVLTAGGVGSASVSRSSSSASASSASYSWTQATAGLLNSSSAYGAAGAGSSRPGDSAATGPNPLASALLAALQQQPPPAHCLPHHLFSQHQRLPHQHPSALYLASPFQQQHLHRRVSWDTEMCQPSASPSQSRRGSSTVKGAESRSDRSGGQLLETSRGIAAAAAQALQQLQHAEANRSPSSGRRLLQRDEDGSVNRAARADESRGSTGVVSSGSGAQQQLRDILQSLSQQERQQEGPPVEDQELEVGDAQMEAMLQQLAATLTASSPESGTPPNKDESPRTEVEPSEAGSADRSVDITELTGTASMQRAAEQSSCRPSLEEGDVAQGVRSDASSVAGQQRMPGSSVDASQTQAEKVRLQMLLRQWTAAVEDSEDPSMGHAHEASANTEMQKLITLHRLEAILEKGREVPFAGMSPTAAGDAAAAAVADNTGHTFYGAVSSQGRRSPGPCGAADSTDKELAYSLICGQRGRATDMTAAAQQLLLPSGGTEGESMTHGGVGASVDFAGAVRTARRGWNVGARDVSPLSFVTPTMPASAGRDVGEQRYGAAGGGASPFSTENELKAAAAALGTAGHFADVDAAMSPVKKKRSRYPLATALAEASPSSVGASGAGERRRGSSRSPGRGSASGAALGEEKRLAAPIGGGRSRRSRRASSSSRRSAEGSTDTPRGSSGAGLEMAAAAAAATAELSAREEAGAASPRKCRQRGAWGGSLSPSPSSRGYHAGESGGLHEEGGVASAPHQKQQVGPTVVGEADMVPLGPLPTGVYFDVARRLWRCQWREEGRLKSKGFSLGHYRNLEEAREACIIYKCAVSNIPVDPSWLVPEYLPASMASKRLVKHRQPSSLPLTSPESSPVPTGMDEPRSPLAAGNGAISAFTPPSSEKSPAGAFSRYGTPITPRATLVASNTDECGGTSQFLSVPPYSAATPTSVSTADYFAVEPSSGGASSAPFHCPSYQSPGHVSVSPAESCYAQESRRSGIARSTPRRSSFETDASPCFLSTEPSRPTPPGQQHLYHDDPLLPVTPSSDAEAVTGESGVINRKRRRFAAEAVGGEAAMNTDVLQVPEGRLPASHGAQLSAVSTADVGAADAHVGGNGSSAFAASLPIGSEAAQESQKSTWLVDVLPRPDRFHREIPEGRKEETKWTFAADTKEAPGVVNAVPSQETPGSWSRGDAEPSSSTDILPVKASAEGSLHLAEQQRSPSESFHSQAPVLTTAAAAAVAVTEGQKEGQHSSVEDNQGEHHQDVLVARASEHIPQLQQQGLSSLQPVSVSPPAGERQRHSESEEEQRTRFAEFLQPDRTGGREQRGC